jgi:hypothetical protein
MTLQGILRQAKQGVAKVKRYVPHGFGETLTEWTPTNCTANENECVWPEQLTLTYFNGLIAFKIEQKVPIILLSSNLFKKISESVCFLNICHLDKLLLLKNFQRFSTRFFFKHILLQHEKLFSADTSRFMYSYKSITRNRRYKALGFYL